MRKATGQHQSLTKLLLPKRRRGRSTRKIKLPNRRASSGSASWGCKSNHDQLMAARLRPECGLSSIINMGLSWRTAAAGADGVEDFEGWKQEQSASA